MKLSPGNLIGLQHHLMPPKPLYEDDGDEVKRVEAYQCPRCGDLHEWRSDAEECCAELKAKADTNCPVCGLAHESHFQAVDCCLAVDLDFAMRLKVASALQNGADWKTALGLQ
jgi:hypothetical protein